MLGAALRSQKSRHAPRPAAAESRRETQNAQGKRVRRKDVTQGYGFRGMESLLGQRAVVEILVGVAREAFSKGDDLGKV